jgi:hypothetical protein
VILGIVLVAFYRKKTGGRAVFISAVVVEIGVIVLGVLSKKGIVGLGFLWLNVVGAVGLVLLSEVLQLVFRKPSI